MKKSFIKMHGLGNDFVIFDGRDGNFKLAHDQIRMIADRRWGIGCDQLIVMEPAKDASADVFMRIYNIDASEAEGCGNATRCVARLMMDETGKDKMVIQTVAGLLVAEAAGGRGITVDMGEIRTGWQQIPLVRDVDTLNVPVEQFGYRNPVAINIGNPHAVFFVENADAVALAEVGPHIETDPMFPAKVNVEFAHILSRHEIRMRVWERGSGITQACGTAACATVAAAVRRGLADRQATVKLDGGDLHFVWRESDNHMLMTGITAEVFRGEIEI